MGGRGSGWQYSSAPTVESLRKLDLADLDRLELRNEGDQVSVASALIELKWNGLRVRYWASNSEYASFRVQKGTATNTGGRGQFQERRR